MNNKLVWLFVVLLLIGGAVYFLSQPQISSEPGVGGAPEQSVATNSPTAVEQKAVTTINVENKGLTFVPNEIRVKQGDRVKIVFKNTGGFHDWVLDEFNVSTDRIDEGKTDETEEFVADKKGTFEYYCSVVFNGVSHRAKGMVGKFIVE